VTLPDGTVEQLAPGATGASSVTFVSTRQLGVYRAEVMAAPSPSREPGATATPAITPTPNPSSSVGAPAAGTEDEPLLFAVDLFSAEESNIAPGDGARISSLGAAVPDDVQSGTSRDEFWPLLVVLALLFLIIEWLVYERDGARRIANSLRRSNPFSNRGRAAGKRGAA
jgi:hypothetical protein